MALNRRIPLAVLATALAVAGQLVVAPAAPGAATPVAAQIAGSFESYPSQDPACDGHALARGIDPVQLVKPGDVDTPPWAGAGASSLVFDFFGTSYDGVWITNDGYVVLDSAENGTPPAPPSNPGPIDPAGPRALIAPFWAGADTTGTGVVTYGLTSSNGRPALCVNWTDLTFGANQFKNTFQLQLVDRGDVGAGDFDIVTTYRRLDWEAISADGLGSPSAAVGYTAADNDPAHSQLAPGSGVPGALLPGGADDLLAGNQGSSLPGQYVTEVRNGHPPYSYSFNGRVKDIDGTPVAGAPVRLCPVLPGDCVTTVTGPPWETGGFGVQIDGFPTTPWSVVAAPPTGLARRSSSPLTVFGVEYGGNYFTGEPVLWPAEPVLPPPGVQVGGHGTTVDGIPIVYSGEAPTISWDGCVANAASPDAEILVVGSSQRLSSLSVPQASPGHYSGVIFPDWLPIPAGAARVEISYNCTDSSTETISFDVRVVADPTSGQLNGRITDAAGHPVAGAPVQACPTGGGGCQLVLTDGIGHYQLAGLAPGSWDLRVTSPGGAALRPASRTGIVLGAGDAQTIDLGLLETLPLTAGTSVNGSTDTSRSPAVDPQAAFTVSRLACAGGVASYTLTADGPSVVTGQLVEGPAGTYSATLGPLAPLVGVAELVISVTCPGGTVDSTEFTIYIDPSGAVINTGGDPVAGATVTLLRSETADGTFAEVPDGSAVMSPANRHNPIVTDTDGRFAWDTVAGYYQVTASKPGCTVPGSTAETVVSAVYEIPPPALDIALVLDCPTPPSTIAPVVTVSPSSVTVVAGQSVSLHAAASGEPTPTVGWQRAEAASTVFTDVPGATATDLSLVAVTPADNGARYRAVFTNAAGTATTDPAVLTVQFKPGAPAITAVSAGDGSVTVAYTPGATGNPAAVFTATAVPVGGGNPATATGNSPLTIGGLSNGIRYSVTVTAANAAGQATSPATESFAGRVPSLTGAAPDAATGNAYSYSYIRSGLPAPTVAVTGGALPQGLTMSPAGVLSGTPTAAGSYSFTLTATNPLSSVQLTDAITITAPSTGTTADLKVTISGPGTARKGDTVTYTVTVIDSGSAAAAQLTTVVTTAGLSGVTASPAAGTGSVRVGSTVLTGTRWTRLSLAAGQTVKYQVTGKVTAVKGQLVAIGAGVVAYTTDPRPADNAAAVGTRVTG